MKKFPRYSNHPNEKDFQEFMDAIAAYQKKKHASPTSNRALLFLCLLLLSALIFGATWHLWHEPVKAYRPNATTVPCASQLIAC